MQQNYCVRNYQQKATCLNYIYIYIYINYDMPEIESRENYNFSKLTVGNRSLKSVSMRARELAVPQFFRAISQVILASLFSPVPSVISPPFSCTIMYVWASIFVGPGYHRRFKVIIVAALSQCRSIKSVFSVPNKQQIQP